MSNNNKHLDKPQSNQVSTGHGPGPGRGMGPMMGGKPKDFKKSMARLLKYIKPFYIPIIIALILAVFGAIFNIMGPKLLGKITSEIQLNIMAGAPINMKKISEIGLLLVCLYGLSFIFTTSQSMIMTKVTQKITQKLRTNISHKINRLPLRYFDSHSYGDVLSRVTNDVDTISQTLNQSIITLISSITTVISIIILMLTISPIMTLIALVTIPLSSIMMAVIMKKSQKYFRSQQQSLGALNGHIEEVYSGHNVIKVFNGSEKYKQKFDNINDKLCKSAYKSQFISGIMMPLTMFIGNISYVIVSVVGSILAISGKLLIGDIQSFIQYIRRFNMPLNNLAQMATTLQSTAAAAERVFEFLEEPELSNESYKTKSLENVKGEVEFRNVKFGYNPDQVIIKNFNAKALPGQKIAIVGPTGAGKTTLVNLLMRFYEINSGEILIDGVPVSELTRENIHSLFGMVLQDTWLFKGTILENLAYGKEGISEEDVVKACKIANVDHFITSLPGGYHMVLSDDSNISQGQKQLLTIARAIVQDAPMLILDEATSSVDTRSEILIQKAMDELMKGRTSFVIAHRLSTIKNADLIIVMKDGDILETGKHEELLSKNGFYADLYNSQFDNALTI
jgi:ATP-binding cassette subfamily B protein